MFSIKYRPGEVLFVFSENSQFFSQSLSWIVGTETKRRVRKGQTQNRVPNGQRSTVNGSRGKY